MQMVLVPIFICEHGANQERPFSIASSISLLAKEVVWSGSLDSVSQHGMEIKF
jgi:hypothetical protein